MRVKLFWFLCSLCCFASDLDLAPVKSLADHASSIAGEWREIETGVFEKSSDGKVIRFASGTLALSHSYDELTRELAGIEGRFKVATRSPTDVVRYQHLVARHEHLASLLAAGDTALLDPRDGALEKMLQKIVVQAEAGVQQGFAHMAYDGACEGVGSAKVDFSVNHVVTRHIERGEGRAFQRHLSKVHPAGGFNCSTYVSAFLSGCDDARQGFELYVSDQNEDCALPSTPLKLEIFDRVRVFDDHLDAAYRANVRGGVEPYHFYWTVTQGQQVSRYQGDLIRFKTARNSPTTVKLVVQDSDSQTTFQSFQVEAGLGFKRHRSVHSPEPPVKKSSLRVGTTILQRCKLGTDLFFQTKASAYGGSPPYRYEWEPPSQFEYLGSLDEPEAQFVLFFGEDAVVRVKVTDFNGNASYGRVYLQGEPAEDPERDEDPEGGYEPRIPDCYGGSGGNGGGDNTDLEDPFVHQQGAQ